MSLAWLGYVGWGILSSAWYVRTLYGGLGTTVAAALVGVFLLFALLTLPLAVWGLSATGGLVLRRAHASVAGVVLLLAAGKLWWLEREARGDVLPEEAIQSVADALTVIDPTARPAPRRRAPSLGNPAPAVCPAPPVDARLTLALTFVIEDERGRARTETRCLQAEDVAALGEALRAVAEDVRRAPIKIDLVTAHAAVPEDAPIAPLALRPGLDGVCAGTRCLMPWQLVLHDAFNQHAPLASVPDARLGASTETLRKLLDGPIAPLRRIATKSWLFHPGSGLVPMERGASLTLDAESLARAASLAENYVLGAQEHDGRFQYMVDPFSGRLDMGDFSIARQAGTTLVVCELAAPSSQRRRVITRSLDMLASLEERIPAGDHMLGVMPFRLNFEEPTRRVGPSALTLVSLLRCRDHLGDVHDGLIGRLARHLLTLQRPDGGFHHHIDRRTGAPVAIDKTIFVDGQIVMGLVMLEKIADQGPFPERAELSAAVERAMQHFATSYWSGFVSDFFFLEENWHCLAAAAALDVHRHDAYEQLCLDYVSFKSRIILDRDRGVSDDFLGGYAVGNVVPPHNTATAGFGEALAAALAIKKARGLPIEEDQALMRSVLGFLINNQWTRERCYACTQRRRVEGGFSEHMASPRVRIDFVQHAWAALGHGGRELGLL